MLCETQGSDALMGSIHLVERSHYHLRPNKDHLALVYLGCILVISGSPCSYYRSIPSHGFVLPLVSVHSALALNLII